MESIAANPDDCGEDLNGILTGGGMQPLDRVELEKFERYVDLILLWNRRVNLTAIRSKTGILTRHFLESIACARALPDDARTLLDYGSGAGFPGIPIAICRPLITVTLAESQNKKAAFLRDASRALGLSCRVFYGRAEGIGEQFDCVTLRAVDRMLRAVRAAGELVKPGGALVPITTAAELEKLARAAGRDFRWEAPQVLPGSEHRVVAIGVKSARPK